jgi:hypothetical protein
MSVLGRNLPTTATGQKQTYSRFRIYCTERSAREEMMAEHNARRLAFAGASLIVILILLCVMLNFTFPEENIYKNGFWVCLGLLFLYVRAVPKKIWVSD